MRFYKPGATEYQSQFSPLNLDFMQKNLVQKEANDKVAEDLIDKASQLKIKGGNYTKDEEIKKYQDWIDTNTATIRDKFYSGELDAKEAARNLGKISQFYNTNEVIKRMNNDYVYSQNQNKNLVEGKLNKAVGTNFNYLGQTPTWDKVNMSEITDDQHAALYNTIAPTSMYDKENYLEQFKDMKAKVSGTSFAGNVDLDFSTGIPLIMNTDGKTVNSQLTRAMVREIAAQMAPQEISNAGTPWVQYNQTKYKGQYNEDNFVDDFENAFTGYVNTYTSDINKHFSQVSGSGSDKTKTTPAPGYYNTAVTVVKNPLGDVNKLNYIQPSSRSNYVVDKNDTPENQKLMREQNKLINKGGYSPVNELSNTQQKILIKLITRANDQEALNLINAGKDLPDALKGKYYAQVKRYVNKINPDEVRLVNNTAIPLSTEEIQTTNNELFGNPNGIKLSNLGTAIGAGMLYMDESGKEYSLKDLIGLHGGDSSMIVTSKADNKNALNLIGGTQDYTNALHVNIEGKRYYTQGKNYSPGTPEYVIQENNKVVNKAFNAKVSGMEEYIPIDGKSQILLEPSGNKVQVRIVDMKGNVIKSYGEAVNVDQTPTAIQQLLNY